MRAVAGGTATRRAGPASGRDTPRIRRRRHQPGRARPALRSDDHLPHDHGRTRGDHRLRKKRLLGRTAADRRERRAGRPRRPGRRRLPAGTRPDAARRGSGRHLGAGRRRLPHPGGQRRVLGRGGGTLAVRAAGRGDRGTPRARRAYGPVDRLTVGDRPALHRPAPPPRRRPGRRTRRAPAAASTEYWKSSGPLRCKPSHRRSSARSRHWPSCARTHWRPTPRGTPTGTCGQGSCRTSPN